MPKVRVEDVIEMIENEIAGKDIELEEKIKVKKQKKVIPELELNGGERFRLKPNKYTSM